MPFSLSLPCASLSKSCYKWPTLRSCSAGETPHTATNFQATNSTAGDQTPSRSSGQALHTVTQACPSSPHSYLSSDISTRQETRMRASVRSEVQGEPEEEAVHEGLHRVLRALQLRSSWPLRRQHGSLRQVLYRRYNRPPQRLHPLPLEWPFQHFHMHAYASFN